METHKEEVIERTQQTEHATLQPTPKELPSLAELYNFLNPEFRALLSIRGGPASAKRTYIIKENVKQKKTKTKSNREEESAGEGTAQQEKRASPRLLKPGEAQRS